MAKQRAVRPAHEWTEDCRVLRHRHCRHVGWSRSVGLLGIRAFVTICSCPCHWQCPSESVALLDRHDACTCAGTGEERQRYFETAAKPSPWRKLLTRRR